MNKLNIFECVEKALEVGGLKFESSSFAPGRSIGFSVEEKPVLKVSIIEVEGVDVIVYAFPFESSVIYATDDVKEFKRTLLQHCISIKVSLDTIKRLQGYSNTYCTLFSRHSYAERDRLLSELEESG